MAGEVKQRYNYDPYGNVTQSDTDIGFTNPYQYAGREADAANLYYYRARYYSPGLGRFISEDPLGLSGGQINTYIYVDNSPILYIDPFGLWSITLGGYVGAGGEFTFGNDNGNSFMTFRVGLGLGGGWSWDPRGGLPGKAPRDRCRAGIIISDSAQVYGRAGFVNAGVEVGAARNIFEGDSSLYGEPGFNLGPGTGVGMSGSVGAQITFYGIQH